MSDDSFERIPPGLASVSDAGSPPPPRRDVELVVKLGGAAITHKDSAVASLNEPALRSVAETIAVAIEELRDDADGKSPKVIVVHGAGSFGHQHAKAYGVARGGAGALQERAPENDVTRRLRLGIAKTRDAVRRLNSLVVSALVDAGVPAVGVSPYGAWSTRGGGKTLDSETSPRAKAAATQTLDAGLVPVLHGDVCFDADTDCAVLSGDVVVRELCAWFRPKRAVFVTDVPGIFDKPPPKPSARVRGEGERGAPKRRRTDATLTLIREVRVDGHPANDAEDVPWHASRVAKVASVRDDGGVAFSDAATSEPAAALTSANVDLAGGAVDVTGGIAGKMREAASVAWLGVDVYVSSHLHDGAAAAIRGRVVRNALEVLPDRASGKTAAAARPWMGTLVLGVETRAKDVIPGLPLDIVVEHVMSVKHMPDPRDLALLRMVSRGMRAAVEKSRRFVDNLDVDEAIEDGCLGTLERLFDRDQVGERSDLCAAIAMNHPSGVGARPVEVMAWARSKGCPWDENVFASAVVHNTTDLVAWMYASGCPWNEKACANAAHSGKFEMLKWLRAKSCPWDHWTCTYAAGGGHLEILKWAHAEGCAWWDNITSAEAAKHGRLEILKWLRAEGCQWGTNTCANAAGGGHLEVLKWARENGCPWARSTCGHAARGGHLETLKWARENGCPWDERTCWLAAEGGQLETLKWARENGCPWNKFTCAKAVERGKLEVLIWARANGAPWVQATRLEASEALGYTDDLPDDPHGNA